MTQPTENSTASVSDYTVGQAVFCHSFGSWYAGTVVKLGRSKVHVDYTTGSGAQRVKACGLDQVSVTAGQSRAELLRQGKNQARASAAARVAARAADVARRAAADEAEQMLGLSFDALLDSFVLSGFDVTFVVFDGQVECTINCDPGSGKSFTAHAEASAVAMKRAAVKWLAAGSPSYAE